MNDPLQILQSEHREIERLLNDVGLASDRQKAVAELQAAIVQHVEREASIVYPDADSSTTDAERLIELTQALAKGDSEGAFDADLSELRAALCEHTDTIGHHVLPALHAKLGETDYLAIGDALVRAQHPDGVDAV